MTGLHHARNSRSLAGFNPDPQRGPEPRVRCAISAAIEIKDLLDGTLNIESGGDKEALAATISPKSLRGSRPASPCK